MLPSQSAHPESQVIPQRAPMHVGELWAGAGQTIPQRPQLFTDVAVSTSQPLATLLSQLAKPGLQVILQVDPTHAGEALVAPGQLVMHPPQ
jgi:hypothetical protein